MPENPNSECSIAASRFEATVLTIGDELSRGEIVDSNAAFLGAADRSRYLCPQTGRLQ